jgi:hypothetical protein
MGSAGTAEWGPAGPPAAAAALAAAAQPALKKYDIKRILNTFQKTSLQSCVAADDVVKHGSCGCCCCCSRKPKHSVLGPRPALHVNPPYDGASCSAFQPADGSRRAAVRIVLSSAVKVNKCCGGFAAHLLVLTNSHVACLEPFQGTVTTASLTVAARTQAETVLSSQLVTTLPLANPDCRQTDSANESLQWRCLTAVEVQLLRVAVLTKTTQPALLWLPPITLGRP